MSTFLSWPVLVTLTAGVGTLSLVSYLVGYREKPGAKWFILTLLGQALFCFAYGIGLTVFDETLRRWLEALALVGLGWLGVPFLGFALEYTGRVKPLQSRWFLVLLSFPAIATVLVPLNAWHGLVWTDFQVAPSHGVATVSYTLQPFAFFGILGAGTVVAVGAFLLFDTVLSYGPLYRGEALAVALSPVPPIAGLFPWLFGFGPAPLLNTVAIGLLPHVVLDMYAFVGSGMFEFYPATNRAAERSTIDDLRSPVVVLEEEGRVVDLNEPAEEILDLDREAAVTKPLSAVVTAEVQSAIQSEESTDRFSVRRDGRRYEFRVEPSPLVDPGGTNVGSTLLFQDITEAVQREERLAVLNRVLRHNLRNDLNVVQGYVAEAQHRTERDEISDLLSRAQSKADDLVAVAGTARDIEETIGVDSTRTLSVDLGDRLTDLADQFEREYPDASVSVDCSVGTVETDPDILESVLQELIENAIVHDRDGTPTVSVGATERDGVVELTVADTGPGMPDHEIATLQRGDETALDHGSGLGLWLVKWGVLRLGGELAFDTNEKGTTARLTIPVDSG